MFSSKGRCKSCPPRYPTPPKEVLSTHSRSRPGGPFQSHVALPSPPTPPGDPSKEKHLSQGQPVPAWPVPVWESEWGNQKALGKAGDPKLRVVKLWGGGGKGEGSTVGTGNIRRKKTEQVVLGSLSRPLIRDHGAPFSQGQWLA